MSIKIVAILGSLRTESYTKKLLIQAQELIKHINKDASIEIYDNIGLLPFVNEDLESDYYKNNKDVIRFKESIRQADGILYATPEYNFGIPGVLKNAIDIASRPRGDKALWGKPYGIISSSPGITGALRAQMSIRSFVFLFGGNTTGYPEFILGDSFHAFTDDGKLKEPQTVKALEGYLQNLLTVVQGNITPNGLN